MRKVSRDYKTELKRQKVTKQKSIREVSKSKISSNFYISESYKKRVKNLRKKGYKVFVNECGRIILDDKYVVCEYIDEMCDIIDDLFNDRILNEKGEVVRCIYITVVSQSGKSTAFSERLPLYVASNYGYNVLLATYNKSLSERISSGNKLLAERIHKELEIEIDSRKNTEAEWGIKRKADGFKKRVQLQFSPFSSISGKQCDVLIMDDIINTDSVYTKYSREKVYARYQSEMTTRRPTYIIMIGTRYHKDDIYGKILEHEKGMWKTLEIPVFREGKKPLGWERGWDEAYWEKIKIKMGNRLFAINAMCDLTGGDDLKLSRSIFKDLYFDYKEEDIYERIISVDGASTLDDGDFSVFICCDVLNDGRVIINDIERFQLEMSEGFDRLNLFLEKHLNKILDIRVVIENASSGLYWLQFLNKSETSILDRYSDNVILVKANRKGTEGVYSGNKESRYYNKLAGQLEYGEFYFKYQGENKDILINELIDFGKEKYDDTMDAFMTVLEACYKFRISCMMENI